MEWRRLVLIASLLLNGYLFSAIRKMDFQAREMTQSATRQRQDLAAITAQLDQIGGQAPSFRDVVSERDLDNLIKTMAQAEADALHADCGPIVLRDTRRLKALEARFKKFVSRYEEIEAQVGQSDFKDPARVKQMAEQLKADVVKACAR